MEIKDSFQTLLKASETNIKTGIDQIRYELAQKGLSKTPAGADIYLERSIDLLANETYKVLIEIKAEIFKPKEWEPIRSALKQFIETNIDAIYDFLVNYWEQPAPPIASQLTLLKSSVLRENDIYIDRQKIKLSRGEQIIKDIIKIFGYGLAAGVVGFLIKFILSH